MNIKCDFQGGSMIIGENAGIACALREHSQETFGGGLSRKAQKDIISYRQSRQDSGRQSPGLG